MIYLISRKFLAQFNCYTWPVTQRDCILRFGNTIICSHSCPHKPYTKKLNWTTSWNSRIARRICIFSPCITTLIRGDRCIGVHGNGWELSGKAEDANCCSPPVIRRAVTFLFQSRPISTLLSEKIGSTYCREHQTYSGLLQPSQKKIFFFTDSTAGIRLSELALGILLWTKKPKMSLKPIQVLV